MVLNQKKNSKILIFIFLNWFYIKIDSKKFCFRFSFFNSIIKFEKWNIFFWISFFHFKSKNEFQNFEVRFSFFDLKRVSQSLFWQVGSKIESKLLWNWIKLFKTFTAVGWRLKRASKEWIKLISIFFCQLLKENLCYAEISEILKKKLPER